MIHSLPEGLQVSETHLSHSAANFVTWMIKRAPAAVFPEDKTPFIAMLATRESSLQGRFLWHIGCYQPNSTIAADDKIPHQPSMPQVSVQLHCDAPDVQFDDTHDHWLLRSLRSLHQVAINPG
jgi:hypothetical protein